MVQKLKRVFGRVDFRVLIVLSASVILVTVGWAVAQLSDDWQTVDSFEELVDRYLERRDSSYMICVPDWYLESAQIEAIESQYGLAGFQSQPNWFVRFNVGEFFIDPKSPLAAQVAHGTQFIIYEDMINGELLVLRDDGETLSEEIVYRSPAWPTEKKSEAFSDYLFRELSKRRVVWHVTLKYESTAIAEQQAMLASQAEDLGGGGMMMAMGGATELFIGGISRSNGTAHLTFCYPVDFSEPIDVFACEFEAGEVYQGFASAWTNIAEGLQPPTNSTSFSWTAPASLSASAFYAAGIQTTHSDGDGLSDAYELLVYKTDPTLTDTDGDSFTDAYELLTTGTNPNEPDSDFDGLDDLQEVQQTFTDPLDSDTDGDTLLDGWEYDYGLNPNDTNGMHGASGDPDNDGLDNSQEQSLGTNPRNADSDGDGTDDGLDASPTEASCFVVITTNGVLPSFSQSCDQGTGSPRLKGTLSFDAGLPTNAFGVSRVILSGYVDDAFTVDGEEIARTWDLEFDTFSGVDVTAFITDQETGAFSIGVYDYIGPEVSNNVVEFNGTFEMDYLIPIEIEWGATELLVVVGSATSLTVNLSPAQALDEVTFDIAASSKATVSRNGSTLTVNGLEAGNTYLRMLHNGEECSSIPVTILNVELDINETAAETDDYVVKQRPSGSQISLRNTPAGASDNHIPMTVRVQPDGFSCKVKLTATGDGEIEIKQTGGTAYPTDGVTVTGGNDLTVWLYGTEASAALNDVVIEARTDKSGDAICGQEDLTVIWIEEENIFFRGSDNQGASLTSGNEAKFSNLASWVNDVVGIQVYAPSSQPIVDAILGQMEMRYKMSPYEIISDVEWDIEREVARKRWLLNLPATMNPSSGIGWAYDNAGDADKDLIQDSNAIDIFQIDAPGGSSLVNGGQSNGDRYVYKAKLREWAEVKIGDNWYVCSEEKYWHAILNATYDTSSSHWIEDPQRTSEVLPGIGSLSGDPINWSID